MQRVRVRQRGRRNGWQLAAVAIALVVLAPLLALAWTAAQGSDGLWSHIAANVLPQATKNTLALLLGVGVLAVVLGTGSAWLVTAYDFPGRKLMAWALLLPLAVPTYIVAYAYLDLLHPLGPVQSAIRALLGYDSPRDFRLPDIRGLAGCIVLLGFVLYPYVYMTTRAMFMTQAASLLEAGRTLGAGRAALFMAGRIAAGASGHRRGCGIGAAGNAGRHWRVRFLGVQTLTVSVYTTWVTRSDLTGAAQIALAMLVIVLALITLERHGRRRQRYANTLRPRPMQPQRLRGAAALGVLALVSTPVLVGFVAPTTFALPWKAGSG